MSEQQRLASFATYPYVEESLTALELAYQIRDFNALREKLEEWFPRPGPGMRKRAVSAILWGSATSYILYRRASAF